MVTESTPRLTGEAYESLSRSDRLRLLIGDAAIGGTLGAVGGGVGLGLLYALRAKTGIDIVPSPEVAPALIGSPAAVGAMAEMSKRDKI